MNTCDELMKTKEHIIKEFLRLVVGVPTEQINGEGMKDTPKRVAKAWESDWGAYYRRKPPNLGEFDIGLRQHINPHLLVVRNIQFHSTCEHHLAPFFGIANVGIVVRDKSPGLSKINRVVKYFAQKLSMQERLSTEIAEYLAASPFIETAIVETISKHLCVCSRGITDPNSETNCVVYAGDLHMIDDWKAEFFSRNR